MLYELNLNPSVLKKTYYKTKIINVNSYSKFKDCYKQFYSHINKNYFLLEPYYYLKNISDNSIYYFIITEIINKYDIVNPGLLFSNSQMYISCLYKMFPNIEFITKNKLCPYKKNIIYNYSRFIKTYKHTHDTIIVHFEEYKSFLINLFITLLLQKENGTLIFNIPSLNGSQYLNIIHFLMYYYKLKIIKPFATRVHTNERYVICMDYNKKNNNEFLKFIEHNIEIVQNNKMPFLQINDMPYYYLKLIIQENTIWNTYVLNILSKFLVNDDIDNVNEQNKIEISKWYNEIST